MAKLPQQPDPHRLASLAPALTVLPAGSLLFRLYRRAGAHPVLWHDLRFFGPTGARFDHHESAATGEPTEQARGITYLAANLDTALAEVFQQDRTVDRFAGDPWLVGFELARAVTLLDLTGRFPLQAGASMKLASGPRSASRSWSRGFYSAYPAIEGLVYPSSLTNEPVYAFYERVLDRGSPFPAHPLVHRALADPTVHVVVRNACAAVGYVMV